LHAPSEGECLLRGYGDQKLFPAANVERAPIDFS
jgi:hypothetical protein